MHNNGRVHQPRITKKKWYTAAEAAVLWARSEGAKNAGDPRIGHYAQLILNAIEQGHLMIEKAESVAGNENSSSAVIISFTGLKEWMEKNYPQARPHFLFK